MRAEQVIYSLLKNDSSVAALVGAKIYPGLLPQNTVLPAISYELISAVDVLPITAVAGGVLVHTRMQVTALARNVNEVKQVLEAVRKALLFKSGVFTFTSFTVRVISITRELTGPDQRDDELGQYLQSIDFLVTHDET